MQYQSTINERNTRQSTLGIIMARIKRMDSEINEPVLKDTVAPLTRHKFEKSVH